MTTEADGSKLCSIKVGIIPGAPRAWLGHDFSEVSSIEGGDHV